MWLCPAAIQRGTCCKTAWLLTGNSQIQKGAMCRETPNTTDQWVRKSDIEVVSSTVMQ